MRRQPAPLLCELHAHTTWSDGELGVRAPDVFAGVADGLDDGLARLEQTRTEKLAA